MRKLISFDLDMTLLNHADYKIPKSAIDTIKKLKENSHIVIIATGRDMGNYYSKEFVDIIQPSAMIEMNGSKITKEGKVIYSNFFEKDLLNRLIDFCIQKKYAIGLTIGDDDYYFNQEEVERIDLETWGQLYRRFKNPDIIRDMDINSLNYIGNEAGAKDIENNFKELKLPMFAGKRGADIIKKDISKARGLEFICNEFGIDIKDTVAFGDSMNDLEIVKRAGIGVAMGNAVDELKEVADFVTDDIDKDGIYKACMELKLI